MLNLPYPGLRPFRPDETYIYFGREKHTDDLLECLDRSRFLAVIGPSGCGKSSLVNTGLIASLQLGMLASTGARWQVARMQPRGQPMRNLADALIASGVVSPLGKPADRDGSSDPAFRLWVENTLARGPLGLKDVLRRHPMPANTNLLLVVDQFEEIFRYRRLSSQDEADAFIALLLRSAGLADYPVFVIITMRSDFLGECTVFPGLPEAINAGQFLTPRLSREEISAAIEGPAQVFGGEVQPELVARLLNAMRSGEDQLPVLQHALMRMWILTLEGEHNCHVLDLAEGDSPPVVLTSEAYRQAGGLHQALSQHADEAFGELDAQGQRIARLMFCALTERLQGQQDIRRPVALSEVADIADVEWQRVAEVAEAFRRPDRCFLVPPRDQVAELGPDTELDISHESLIRQWQRLSEWVRNEYEAARNYRRLEDRAILWREKKADLLGDIELSQALQWRSSWSPSAAWAKRYGSDYPLAVEYLERSEQAQEQARLAREREREEEEQRRRAEEREKMEAQYQRQRTRRLLRGVVVTSVLMVVALLGWVAAYLRGESAAYAHLYERAQSRSMMALDQKQTGRALLLGLAADHYSSKASQTPSLNVDVTRLLLKSLQSESAIRKIYDNESGSGRTYSVAFSADGSQVAIGGQEGDQRAGTISLRDTGSGGELRNLRGHADAVTSLAYLEDGRHLVSGGWDHHIRLWDTATGTELSKRGDAQCLVDSLVSYRVAAGSYLIYALGREPGQGQSCRDGKSVLWYWQLVNNQFVGERRALEPIADVTAFALAPARGLLMVALSSGQVEFRDAARPEQVAAVAAVVPDGEAGWQDIELMASNPAGSRLAVSYEQSEQGLAPATPEASNDIILWDTTDLENVHQLASLRGQKDLLTMTFSADGQRLASGGQDAEVLVWEVASVNGLVSPAKTFSGHNDWVRSVAFSPDGESLVSGSGSGRSILWSVGAHKNLYRALQSHSDEVWSLVFAGSGSGLLVSGGRDRMLSVWNLGNLYNVEGDFTVPVGREVFSEHQAPVVSLTASAEAGILLSAGTLGDRGEILGWRIAGGQLTLASERSMVLDGGLSGIALSPDGNYLAVSRSGPEGGLALWQWADTGWVEQALPSDLPGTTGWGDNLAFSADSETLAFAAFEELDPEDESFSRKEYFVQLIELADLAGSPDMRISSPGRIFSVAFFAGVQAGLLKERIAFGGDDHEIHLWSRQSRGPWEHEHSMAGHAKRINSLAFSPDGRTIASGSRDESVRLWDTLTGDGIGTLVGHDDLVDRVAFSPGGRFLASAGDDHNVYLWNVDFASYRNIACEVSSRNLTQAEWDKFVRTDPDKEDWLYRFSSTLLVPMKQEYLLLCPDYPSGETATGK